MNPLFAALGLTLFAAAPAVAAGGDAFVSGAVFSGASLASDYRYAGVSEASGQPVIQGYAHWYRPDGFFAGVFATKLNFGYAAAPTYEVDSYAGRNFAFDKGRGELKIEGLYSAFPNNRTPGPTFDFFEGTVQLKHVHGAWTTIGLVTYVPSSSYGSGRLLRVEGETDIALSKTMTLKALVGHQSMGFEHERTYWSVGAARTFKTVTFDLRYVGTDRTRDTCGFQPKACGASVVAFMTIALPTIVLRRR